MNIAASTGSTSVGISTRGAGNQPPRMAARAEPAATNRATRAKNGRGRWQMPIRARPRPTKMRLDGNGRTTPMPTSDTRVKSGSRNRSGASA